jgi:hypothetical protein
MLAFLKLLWMFCRGIFLVNVASIGARLITGAAVSAASVDTLQEDKGGGRNVRGIHVSSEFLEEPVSPLGCWFYLSSQATLAQHIFVIICLYFQ